MQKPLVGHLKVKKSVSGPGRLHCFLTEEGGRALARVARVTGFESQPCFPFFPCKKAHSFARANLSSYLSKRLITPCRGKRDGASDAKIARSLRPEQPAAGVEAGGGRVAVKQELLKRYR